MVSVTLDHVTKRFGQITALDAVTLRIEPGELFFLLGPSGCGKTTLLRHIAGFYLPDEGRVLFDADDVTRVPPHRRNTGMMFQSYALWPHMTVAGNVAFGLEERRTPKAEIAQRVQEALESVRMGEYAQRKINQLSGGQQQRVALARALVIRPRCLLLDEPLSNLDAKLRLEMRAEIRRVCKEFGLTAVYVTHDQKEALSIADRMAILDSGRVAQVGAPLEIYRSPRTRLVADFIGESNFFEGRIVGPADGGFVAVESVAGRFAGRTTDPSWQPAAGDPAVICVRPESFRLSENGADTSARGGNAVSGRVTEAVYLGELAQYRLAASGGAAGEIKVFEMNPRRLQSAERDAVASVAPEDTIVLRR